MQHHPVRPHSQQDARDPRYAPIPPPPYSTRPSSARPDILHSSDPFLRRRVDVAEQPMHSQPYAYTTAPNYTTPSLGIHGLGEIRRDDHGQVARDRHEHIGQYGSQLPEAPPLSVLPPPPPPSSRCHVHPERQERHPDFWKDIPASTTAAAATMFAAPPPPPYGGPRTMLPPTSPQNHQPQYNGQTTSSRPSIPLPPSFTGARGVSALPTSRPESSMSISSMLGSDVGQPTKDNSSTLKSENGPSVNGSFSSPARTTKTMSSPTRRTSGSALFRRRSPSPGDRKRTEGVANRPFRAFSNDNQRHAPPNVRPTSPAAYSLSTSSQSNNQRPLTAEQAPGQQWRFSHHRHSSGSKPGKRPNSQPSGHNTPSQAPPDLRQPRSAVSTTDRYRDLQVAQKYDQLAQEAKRKFNYGPADRPTQQFLEGHIRRMQDERAAKAADTRRSPNMSHRPHSVARPSVTTDLPQNLPINRFRSDIENVDHVYNRDPQDVPTATQSPFSPDYLRRSREERLVTNDPQPPTLSISNSTQSRYSDRREERHRQQFPSTQQPTAANMDRSVSMNGIDHSNKIGDEIIVQQPRHSLSLLIENGRRGRVSPLPQAVQGAQGRNSGPASDPGIKNEFGRMFSGIGSGVGSTGPVGSGTSTPFPASPKVNHEPERRTPFASRGELFDLTRPRERSKLGKRGLAKDDETRVEVENGATPNVTGSSGRRMVKKRHSHHHHSHNHHHHHHRHDEPGLAGLTMLSGANGKRLSTPVLEPAGLTAAQSTTTTKLGVSSVPKPLPRYEGKENCTFTVRVPRFYLSDVEREEVTRQRAVWGYDVYTDDSDPLAAAIHAGWIQGSWRDDIDVSMLELSSSSTRAAGKAAVVDVESIEGSLTSPPSQPMVPPKNKDLHLTCLVLPALEQYASKVCNGIKSRAWGNNHDGISFRIEKVEWVEEGIGKGEARTGEARRKRMRGLMDERRRFRNGFASPVVRVAGALGDGGERASDIVAVGA
ncbi:MAG: hypothetical protein LQ344_004537 [Seirophora lacunosa]|nr:MAG: hypothetical protein LQ344_004537 [Seirophora lacunosa]